jgi:nucleoside-diphosphate-sugar epimerase
MNILITGAGGFLGQECARQLVDRGHRIVSTDRRGQVDFLGDLADPNFAAALPAVDAVIHAAAVQYVSQDLPLFNRTNFFEHNNIRATQALCQRYSGQATHFVHVATSMMYDQVRLPLYRTTSPLKGQGVYSRSKLQAQQFVEQLPNPTATVVPCIIGGQGREGLFRSFISMMQKYGLVVFPGTGQYLTHMGHFRDVAGLIVQIIETHATGRFNAAAPDPLSINQWIDEIQDELKLNNIKRIRLPLDPIHFIAMLTGYRLLAREQLLMLGQSHVLAIDESLAIGWKPQYSNAQIVRDIARYITEPGSTSISK